MNKKMKDNYQEFPHPLDTDLEQQIPVQRISVDNIDDRTGAATYSVKTVIEKQHVRYIHAPKERYRCQPGEHVFRVLNKKRGVFGCQKCQFAARIHPANYKYDNGKLIHRDTGRVV